MFASDNFSRELVPYQSRNIVEYLGQVLHEPRETLLSALKRTSPLIIVSGMALGSYYVGFPLLSTLLNHSDVRQVTETPLEYLRRSRRLPQSRRAGNSWFRGRLRRRCRSLVRVTRLQARGELSRSTSSRCSSALSQRRRATVRR